MTLEQERLYGLTRHILHTSSMERADYLVLIYTRGIQYIREGMSFDRACDEVEARIEHSYSNSSKVEKKRYLNGFREVCEELEVI